MKCHRAAHFPTSVWSIQAITCYTTTSTEFPLQTGTKPIWEPQQEKSSVAKKTLISGSSEQQKVTTNSQFWAFRMASLSCHLANRYFHRTPVNIENKYRSRSADGRETVSQKIAWKTVARAMQQQPSAIFPTSVRPITTTVGQSSAPNRLPLSLETSTDQALLE